MRALVVIAPRFERIRKVEHAIERRHLLRANGVFCNCGKHARIAYAKILSCERRSEASVKHDWVGAFECADRYMARFAFEDEPGIGIESREIVEQAGETRFARIKAVQLRQNIRATCDANHMLIAMLLTEMFAYRCGSCVVVQRSAFSRVR